MEDIGVRQSGFTRSGLATTTPELAPATHSPADPILHSKSASAIGVSVSMNESTERFRSWASRSLTPLPRSGRPMAVCKARPLTNRRDVKECMVE
jgi:hypothetical protein